MILCKDEYLMGKILHTGYKNSTVFQKQSNASIIIATQGKKIQHFLLDMLYCQKQNSS